MLAKSTLSFGTPTLADVLPADEPRSGQHHQLLTEWNDTRFKDELLSLSFKDLFERQVERTPDVQAVADLTSGTSLTFHELNLRANLVAHRLLASRLGVEDRVGLFVHRSLDLVAGILGILKAGCTYVPLDPEYPSERLAWILHDASLRAILTHPSLADHEFFHTIHGHPTLEVIDLRTVLEKISRRGSRNPQSFVPPESAAYTIYTSGSTGNPKGVVVPHRSLTWYTLVAIRNYGFNQQDRVLQFSAVSFDISVEEIFPSLACGATLILRNDAMASSVKEFFRRSREWSITVFTLPTAFWHLATVEVLRQPTLLPRTLRLLILGGERVHPNRVAAWQKAVGSRVKLVNTYGPTETTVVATLTDVTKPFPKKFSDDFEPPEDLPIGRPIPGAEAYVFKSPGETAAVAEEGELLLGGAGVARGYLNQPRKTAECFIPHPWSGEGGSRLYRTGDRARFRADGQLDYLGRFDDQIKIHGYRVEPSEIESLLRAHPAVQEAAVVAQERSPGDRRLLAFVVAETAGTAGPPESTELRGYLRTKVPPYMLPAQLIFLDELPLGPNGKLDRTALAHRRLPGSSHLEAAPRKSIAPRTPTEKALAEIWSEVLRVEKMCVHDNVFELGTDSIINLQVVSKAREKGIRVTPREIFDHPTIASLAAIVSAKRRDRETDEIPTEDPKPEVVTGPIDLTPIQRWFFEDCRTKNPWHFNQSIMLEVRRPLDVVLLQQALRRIIDHHDALRLRFHQEDGHWRQIGTPIAHEPPPFVAVDLSKSQRSSLPLTVRAVASRLQASLDLTNGPLLRAAYFNRGPLPARLCIVIHHLAVDGVSWRILVADLESVYLALEASRKVSLPPKTTSFKAWSELLKRHANTPETLSELPHWLHAAQPTADLPMDFPDLDVATSNTEASETRITVDLDAESTHHLLRQIPAVYRTQINDVLLSALALTLRGWTGQHRFLIELEGHGREHIVEDIDLSHTIGWFTSAFPVSLDVEGVFAPGEVLKTIKEQLREIPRRGLGFPLLKYLCEEAEVVERLTSLPAPQISFNYLSQSDPYFVDSVLFAHAAEPTGSRSSRRGFRNYIFEVAAYVADDRLWVTWVYSSHLHQRSTIESLAAAFLTELKGLIAHCLEPTAGGFTKSDFPLAHLTTVELTRCVGADRNVEDIYPLSPVQHGILFHTLYSPRSSIYFEQSSWALRGSLDPQSFHHAWEWLQERHAILRTSFMSQGLSNPMQLVRLQAPLPWVEEDWSHLPPEEQEALLPARLLEDRRAGFDLSRAPLMRCLLIRLGEDSWRFTWSAHHLILDGWSISLLFDELFQYYFALTQGMALDRPRPRPFRDYVSWLRQQDTSESEVFWRRYLHGFRAPTPLPLSLGNDPESFRETDPGYEQRHLCAEATSEVFSFARGHRLTLGLLVQAAWGFVLGRLNGQDDVVFGTTFSGRPTSLPGSDEIVGILVNTLPVRVRLSADSSVIFWLKELQDQNVQIGQHQYSALVDIHNWSEVTSPEPLFRSAVGFQNYPGESSLRERHDRLELGDLLYFSMTSYPLVIEVIPDDRLWLQARYDRNCFHATSVSLLLRHLGTVLQSLAASSDRPLSSLATLTPTEHHQILYEWNGPEVGYARERRLHVLFEEQARRTPERTALLCPVEHPDAASPHTVTYRELSDRALRLAWILHRKGLPSEQVVALLLERSCNMVVALLGVLKAGGAYLPLDPDTPSKRLAHILEDSGASFVITETPWLDRLPEAPRLHTLCIDTDLEDSPPAALPERTAGNHLAYVLYTSGSTGRPKGVMISHDAIGHHMHWMQDRLPLHEEDRLLQKTPYTFDASVWEFWAPLFVGAQIVLARPGAHRDPLEMIDALRRHRITVLQLVPTQLRMLLDYPEFSNCRHLRRIYCGGEPLTPDLRKRFVETGLNAELINVYGPTEGSIHATSFRLDASRQATPYLSSLPIGRPISNTRALLLDENHQIVPMGVAAELRISGPGLGRGYLNAPALTAERFLPDPYADVGGSRAYRTGDLARFRWDGHLEFLGRIDHQIKLRGYRVEIGEIEALLEEHPAVRQAVVVPWSRKNPSTDTRLVAYLRTRNQEEDFPPLAESLRDHLSEHLPEYMRPASLLFLDEMPLLPNGKVNRRALPSPESFSSPSETSPVSPRNTTEEVLEGIWREVLGLPAVGVRANFFDLGGHSLLATQVVSRIRSKFAAEVPLRTLFESPTIEQLAEHIDSQLSKVRKPAQPVAAQPAVLPGELPLSFAQQRLWFLDQMTPGTIAYNMTVEPWEMTGGLDVAALQAAFREIFRRHNVLRTTFTRVEGIPRQQVSADLSFCLPLVDLSCLASSRRERESQRLTKFLSTLPFDLTRGPLLRVVLLRLEPTRHVLSRTVHHIASDGWSEGIMTREITEGYDAAVSGRRSRMPELPIQYADFAVWQRSHIQGETLENLLSYWRRQLAGLASLNLPSDRGRPAVQKYQGGLADLVLPGDVADALRTLSRERRVSLFMTLLAVFMTLMRRYTGQDDVAVGSPIANRNRAEIEPLIGFFVNTLVLRGRLSEKSPFLDFLEQVRDTALEAYAHQDLPFERLVEELHPTRELNRNPLFQVALALQNAPESRIALEGLEVRPQALDFEPVAVDLILHLWEGEDELHGYLLYDTDLFDSTRILRFVGHFRTLVREVVRQPAAPLGELSYLSREERHQLLQEWNETDEASPFHGFHTLFEAQARRYGERTALRYTSPQGAEVRWTYRELDSRASSFASRLRSVPELLDGGEKLVALALERSPEMVVALLGILKAGFAFVPLDPAYPPERLAYMLSDCGAALTVTRRGWLDRLPQNPVRALLIEDMDLTAAPPPSSGPPIEADGDRLAYVIYTSGSTGRPKGSMLHHRGMCNLAADLTLETRPDDIVLQFASLSFDASIFEMVMAFGAGAALDLGVGGPHPVGRALTDLLAERKVTQVVLPPTALAASPAEASSRLGNLRTLLVAGEACPPDLPITWSAAGRRFLNAYGPTEATVCATVGACPGDGGKPSIGRPIQNFRLFLLDKELRPVAAGIPGELYLAGTGLARGYLSRPGLTADRFLPNPFASRPGERLYRTGDRVRYLGDGSVDFLGRIDTQVKVRGFRIELGEVESALCKLPAVREAVVETFDASKNGDGDADRQLVAYVVPAEGGAAPERSAGKQVASWQAVYEDLYSGLDQEAGSEEASLDIKGWKSSFTDQEIPKEEMQEWIDETVGSILDACDGSPGNVLEIGCGTGLLLWRIAPKARRYLGTDFSLAVIDRLSARLRKSGQGLSQVELRCQSADERTGIDRRSFDLVLLNSVIQYFPSAEYLLDVLKGAVAAAASGGTVFLGDIRSLPLYEAFCTSAELTRADDSLSLQELRQRIDGRKLREKELVIDPKLFTELPHLLPRIRSVKVRPKLGRARNEMSCFRYDVVLHLDTADRDASGRSAPDSWLSWTDDMTVEALRRELESRPDLSLGLRRVPDARVAGDLHLLRLVQRADDDATVAELRGTSPDETGVEPAVLQEVALDAGATLEWIEDGFGRDGCYDVVFWRSDPSRRGAAQKGAPEEAGSPDWHAWVNDPLASQKSRQLVSDLRRDLETQLPPFMIPGRILLLPQMPLLPNGKVDRKRLPAPDRRVLEPASATPRTPTEQSLLSVWSEVLGVEGIGIHDNFFELGGHSLNATQVQSRIEQTWNVQFPLRRLFEHSTVAQLAGCLNETVAMATESHREEFEEFSL